MERARSRRRRTIGEPMIEADHQIAKSSGHTSILVHVMTRPHRDEPYWECLHHPAVLLIPKSVMLPRAGVAAMWNTRCKSFYSTQEYHTSTENGANLSSYVGKISEPRKVRNLITRSNSWWKEMREETFQSSLFMFLQCNASFDFSIKNKDKKLW